MNQLRIMLFALLCIVVVRGFSQSAAIDSHVIKPSETDIKQGREIFLRGFQRSYTELDKPLITDLTVVIPELVRILPDTVPSSEQLARFKRESDHIDFPFHVPVEKGPDSHTDYIGVVKIGAHSSLKEAEEHYVWRLGILQVLFHPGTVSQRPIGEASAYHEMQGYSTALYFLRRNLVVIVQYASPVEVLDHRDKTNPKASMIRRRRFDVTITSKCEDLAREIDAFLISR